MIDNLSLLISHGLLLLAIWRLLGRDDLDRSPPPEDVSPALPPAEADADQWMAQRRA